MHPDVLLGSPTSPFVRLVRVLAAERGVPLTVEWVSAFDDDPRLLAHSPVCRVPALRTSEGVLVDSRSICQWLDPSPRALPDLAREGLAHGLMEAAVAVVMMRRRPPGEQHPPTLARQTARIHRITAALTTDPSPTVGTIAAACALAYLDFRLPDLDWRAGNLALSGWLAGFLERPPMVETAFPGGR